MSEILNVMIVWATSERFQESDLKTKKSISMKRITFLVVLLLSPVQMLQAQQWAENMFSELNHDFGYVAKGSDVRHNIEITNKFEETVHISGVSTSCGCTVAKQPEKTTLPSRESTFLEISMNTQKFSRLKESSVTVTFDKPYYAQVRIPIRAYIRTDVVLSPGGVEFGEVELGEGKTTTVDINYAGRSDWTITGVSGLPSNLEASVEEVSRRGNSCKYKLTVNLKPGAPKGDVRAKFSLLTDDAKSPEVPVMVTGRVVPDIVVQDEVTLGLLAPGQSKTVSVVLRGKKPFKITQVECDTHQGAFSTKVPEETKVLHILPLTVKTPDMTGTFTDTISVTIDGRPEPVTFKTVGQINAPRG